MRAGLLLTFLGMGLVTYLTRVTLTILVPRHGLAPFWERVLEAIPLAALTALVAPTLWPPAPAAPVPWSSLLGALVALVLARATRSLVVPAAAGTAAYLLLRHLL